MKKNKMIIENIPAVIYGNPSEEVYWFIQGQGGNKEEVERYEQIH